MKPIFVAEWHKSPVLSVEALQVMIIAVQNNSAAKVHHNNRASKAEQDQINGN